MGIGLAQAVQACTHLTSVPGRMQAVSLDGSMTQDAQALQQLPMVVVDYAHTPDAVSHALLALRSMATARGGQLWCVLGCGGDRDASKRPHMAAAAQAAADQLVLTSDNPRSESPEAILADMMAGLMRTDSVRIQLDRARAVSEVVALAGAADVVLVAGKGHESTQEIMGVFHPYSDVTQVLSALQSRLACLQEVGA
jgi:UDP-N-acetylmuramoyl-L-alanyl-D-glutamate--2,6-diaminopimelate ligase